MTISEVVKNFCVRKLAQIIHDCAQCRWQDRAETDWKTAELFVEMYGHSVAAITCGLSNVLAAISNMNGGPSQIAKNASCLTFYHQQLDYDFLDRVCGRAVWEHFWQKMQYNLPPAYSTIRFH